MLDLPENGYTPANYAKLVELTQLSNIAFCEKFDIPKGTFEKHKGGTRTMKWKNWQALQEAVAISLRSMDNCAKATGVKRSKESRPSKADMEKLDACND